MTQAQAIGQAATPSRPSPGDEARSAFPAQVQQAMAYAQANRYAYGPKFSKLDLTLDVTGAERRPDGAVRVMLSFRPAKQFRGRAGSESVDIRNDGTVTARSVTHVPREDLPWVLIALAVISVMAAGALVPWVLFYEGGDSLYVAGRIMYIRSNEPQLAPYILFTGPDVNNVIKDWAIKAEGTGTELAFFKVTLVNAQSGSVKVIIDEGAAEIRTSDDQTYKPLDTVKRTYQTDTKDPRRTVTGFLPLWSPAKAGGTDPEALTLKENEQVEGYLVFEVPKGSKIEELRWNATDSAVIRF